MRDEVYGTIVRINLVAHTTHSTFFDEKKKVFHTTVAVLPLQLFTPVQMIIYFDPAAKTLITISFLIKHTKRQNRLSGYIYKLVGHKSANNLSCVFGQDTVNTLFIA